MKTFRNRVTVITGGASGFGKEFALIAARLGMKIVIADVQQDALDAVHTELTALGADVLAVRCDVRHANEVQALADATMKHFGAVHLVFNNAGVGSGGLVWENSQADWEWVLGVNLWGVIHGVRIFTNLMLACAKQDPEYEGHIVNTSSMAGMLNAPTMGVYNVSKHAVVSLTETLYQDLKLMQLPINASVLCPYFVPTGISQSHRNRPEDVPSGAITASQRAAQIMSDKAVNSGKITAAEVAEKTFNAIRDEQFYIFSHEGALAGVQTRMEDIMLQRNPSDPYEATPHIREMLRAKIGSAG